MSVETLRAKIAGREWAEEVIAFAMEDAAGWDGSYAAGFWQEIRRACDEADPLPNEKPTRPTMDDIDAKHFEGLPIGFGAHIGKTYADVPTDYLQWLHENGERLAAYLRSERGKRRQDERLNYDGCDPKNR